MIHTYIGTTHPQPLLQLTSFVVRIIVTVLEPCCHVPFLFSSVVRILFSGPAPTVAITHKRPPIYSLANGNVKIFRSASDAV